MGRLLNNISPLRHDIFGEATWEGYTEAIEVLAHNLLSTNTEEAVTAFLEIDCQ
jgi:hypothetical protein